MKHAFFIDGEEHLVWLSRRGDTYCLEAEGRTEPVTLDVIEGPRHGLSVGAEFWTVAFATEGDDVWIHIDGLTHVVRYRDAVERFAAEGAGAGEEMARAPMPGTVVELIVQPGQSVAMGDGLIVIESMKLETTIRAWRDGEIEAIHVAPGATFDRDAPLVSLAPAGGA